MEDEISYLLRMPSDEIMKVVLQEALKDLTITSEEKALISGIEHDLSTYTERIPKFNIEHPFTKSEIQILLVKQRRILKGIVTNTYKRAAADGTISTDEMSIYRSLLHKVDEISARKISMFLNLDSFSQSNHLLLLNEKLNEKFKSLTSTIIMDILSEKVGKQEKSSTNVKEVVKEFTSDDTNKEFVSRLKEALRDLLRLPMENPEELLVSMEKVMVKKEFKSSRT